MPIRPEQRALYPADWPDISRRIRFERAAGRCECTGECGHDHLAEFYEHPLAALIDVHELGYRVTGGGQQADALVSRCLAQHRRPHPETGSRVVLTTAHLDHQPENCADENLRAMCQRCHLAYDRDHHARTRAATKTKERHR